MEPYILIVDDDVDARSILSIVVEHLGWKHKVAMDGAQALEMINEHPPVLVLLDLMMPAVSGFDVLANVKSRTETRDIPVVLISAMGTDQRLARLGASRVIPKGDRILKDVATAITELIGTRDEMTALGERLMCQS